MPDRAEHLTAAAGGDVRDWQAVTASLLDGPESTSVRVRGAAKEGLFKQRAGEKTAKRVGLLTQWRAPESAGPRGLLSRVHRIEVSGDRGGAVRRQESNPEPADFQLKVIMGIRR